MKATDGTGDGRCVDDSEGAFYSWSAVKRMGAMHVPIRFAAAETSVPTEQTVFETARAMCVRPEGGTGGLRWRSRRTEPWP